MKNMNLPNKLTMLRIAMVPFIVAAMLIEFPLHYLAAGLLFGAASFTDALDGKIARRDNLITDFGKFADPLADKILVISVLVCFVKADLCGAVPLIIILFREFAVTSIRLVAATNGKVIAANMWGKIKTISQISVIVTVFILETVYDVFVLCTGGTAVSVSAESAAAFTWKLQYGAMMLTMHNIFTAASQVMMWIIAVITVASGVVYIKDNKGVIADM